MPPPPALFKKDETVRKEQGYTGFLVLGPRWRHRQRLTYIIPVYSRPPSCTCHSPTGNVHRKGPSVEESSSPKPMVSKFTPSSLRLGNDPRLCQVYYADCIDYACIVRFTNYARSVAFEGRLKKT